jgi:hypothetical protein
MCLLVHTLSDEGGKLTNKAPDGPKAIAADNNTTIIVRDKRNSLEILLFFFVVRLNFAPFFYVKRLGFRHEIMYH